VIAFYLVLYTSASSGLANNVRLNELLSAAEEINTKYKVIIGDFDYPHIEWADWS